MLFRSLQAWLLAVVLVAAGVVLGVASPAAAQRNDGPCLRPDDDG